MRSTQALALASLVVLCGSGCATVVKGSKSELVLRQAPADLKAFAADGAVLTLKEMSKEKDGSVHYKLTVPPKAEQITLQTDGQRLPVTLKHHIGAGWMVADIVLTLGVGVVVDAITKRWFDFNEVNVATVVADAAQAGEPVLAASDSPPLPDLPVVSESKKPEPTRLVERAPPDEPVQRSAPPPSREPVVKSGKLAVLDFKSYAADFKPEDVRYFSDLVRGATLRASPTLVVMTRENLIVLLQATGKDLGQCEGECEVDTGRRIGADAVISGEVLKVGSRYKMSLKLHETRNGRLLSTAVASGKTIDDLDESVQKAAFELMHPTRDR